MNESNVNCDSSANIHVVQKLYGHSSDVSCCDFSGNKLVTCSTDKSIRIWDVQNELEYVESLHSPLVGHKYGILSCCFSPFGSLLATSSIDGNIILWNVQVWFLLINKYVSFALFSWCIVKPSFFLRADWRSRSRFKTSKRTVCARVPLFSKLGVSRNRRRRLSHCFVGYPVKKSYQVSLCFFLVVDFSIYCAPAKIKGLYTYYIMLGGGGYLVCCSSVL